MSLPYLPSPQTSGDRRLWYRVLLGSYGCHSSEMDIPWFMDLNCFLFKGIRARNKLWFTCNLWCLKSNAAGNAVVSFWKYQPREFLLPLVEEFPFVEHINADGSGFFLALLQSPIPVISAVLLETGLLGGVWRDVLNFFEKKTVWAVTLASQRSSF